MQLCILREHCVLFIAYEEESCYILKPDATSESMAEVSVKRRRRSSSDDKRQDVEATRLGITPDPTVHLMKGDVNFGKKEAFQQVTDQHVEKKECIRKSSVALGEDASKYTICDVASIDNMSPIELRNCLHDAVYTLLRLGCGFTQIVAGTGVSETFLKCVFCELGLNVPSNDENTDITDEPVRGRGVMDAKKIGNQLKMDPPTQSNGELQEVDTGIPVLSESNFEGTLTTNEEVPRHANMKPSETPSFDFELPKKLSRELHKYHLTGNDSWTSELKVNIDSEDESGSNTVRQPQQNLNPSKGFSPSSNDTNPHREDGRTEMFQQIRNFVMKMRVETSRLSSLVSKNGQFARSLSNIDRARLQNLKSAIFGDLDKLFLPLLTIDPTQELDNTETTATATRRASQETTNETRQNEHLTSNASRQKAAIEHPPQNLKENVAPASVTNALEGDKQVSEPLINDSIVKITKVCMIQPPLLLLHFPEVITNVSCQTKPEFRW